MPSVAFRRERHSTRRRRLDDETTPVHKARIRDRGDCFDRGFFSRKDSWLERPGEYRGDWLWRAGAAAGGTPPGGFGRGRLRRLWRFRAPGWGGPNLRGGS